MSTTLPPLSPTCPPGLTAYTRKALVELMQKDSTLPCFAAFGEQTASQLRERFQQGLTQSAVEEHVQRLIDTSLGSNWTRLYDSVRTHALHIAGNDFGVLTPPLSFFVVHSISTTRSLFYEGAHGILLLSAFMCYTIRHSRSLFRADNVATTH